MSKFHLHRFCTEGNLADFKFLAATGGKPRFRVNLLEVGVDLDRLSEVVQGIAFAVFSCFNFLI